MRVRECVCCVQLYVAIFFFAIVALRRSTKPEVSVRSQCGRVYAYATIENAHRCKEYEELPLIIPDCQTKQTIVPRILHVVGRSVDKFALLSLAATNPTFNINALNDSSAVSYIADKCGRDAVEAYKCLKSNAFRGDLFRYCALLADGGIYLDQDIMPLKPLDELISPCSVATVGHDFPLDGIPAKQTKILSAAPQSDLMRCAVHLVVENVRKRLKPENPLELSATRAMQHCYAKYPHDVAITYIDSREAVWPFTGMRRGIDLIAFERASTKHFKPDPDDYSAQTTRGDIYESSCTLSQVMF